MKPYHFILAGLLSLTLVSCNLRGKNESTPHFDFRVMRISGNDTTFLSLRANTLDTLSVGETIHFQTVLASEFSPLKEYRITANRPSAVRFIWESTANLNQAFNLDASNLAEGVFVTRGIYYGIPFDFQYLALEATEDLTLSFTVVNGGSSGYNTQTLTIRTPIKE
jgi:hypothetical protein